VTQSDAQATSIAKALQREKVIVAGLRLCDVEKEGEALAAAPDQQDGQRADGSDEEDSSDSESDSSDDADASTDSEQAADKNVGDAAVGEEDAVASAQVKTDDVSIESVTARVAQLNVAAQNSPTNESQTSAASRDDGDDGAVMRVVSSRRLHPAQPQPEATQ